MEKSLTGEPPILTHKNMNTTIVRTEGINEKDEFERTLKKTGKEPKFLPRKRKPI